MKKEELRISNYYHSVKFNKPVQCTIEDFYELYARCDGVELDEETIAEIFEPIELSLDILSQFGFTKSSNMSDNWHLQEIYYKLYVRYIKKKFTIYALGSNGVCRLHTIKYAHELQSIFLNLKNIILKL